MADEEQDIYDVAPAIDKTVSDIGKLRNMFETKPTAYTGRIPPNSKAFQPAPTEPNKPAPAVKPKPGQGKLIMPAGFQNELQNKQKQIGKSNAPCLPAKGKRTSIDIRGDITKSSDGLPFVPKKDVIKSNKPTPPVIKEKPKVPLKENAVLPTKSNGIVPNKILSNDPVADKNKNSSVDNKVTQKASPRGVQFDNNVEYMGDIIHGPDGEKYRMVKCTTSPGPPPAKKPLPSKINIDDILQQYAEDDDMYDDVITEDPTSRVSVIPEFTEEEERELAVLAKENGTTKQEQFEQEEYDDVVVGSADRKEKSLSLMSTGSDIYETFDDIPDGGDVKL